MWSYCVVFGETLKKAHTNLSTRHTDMMKPCCCTWQISHAEKRRQEELRLSYSKRSQVMDVRFERAEFSNIALFVFPPIAHGWQALCHINQEDIYRPVATSGITGVTENSSYMTTYNHITQSLYPQGLFLTFLLMSLNGQGNKRGKIWALF